MVSKCSCPRAPCLPLCLVPRTELPTCSSMWIRRTTTRLWAFWMEMRKKTFQMKEKEPSLMSLRQQIRRVTWRNFRLGSTFCWGYSATCRIVICSGKKTQNFCPSTLLVGDVDFACVERFLLLSCQFMLGWFCRAGSVCQMWRKVAENPSLVSEILVCRMSRRADAKVDCKHSVHFTECFDFLMCLFCSGKQSPWEKHECLIGKPQLEHLKRTAQPHW